MNTLRTSILALAAILAAPLAQAEDIKDPFYAGATIGQRSTLTLSDGVNTVKSSSEPRAFGLRGGYEFNEHFAVEGGYTRFGMYKFPGNAHINMGTLYAAAKGSFALGDKFSLFGKAGIARNTLKLVGTNSDDDSYSKTRAMFGAGVAYRVSEQVALTAEVVDYGTLRTGAGKVKMRQVEAGLNFHF